MDPGIDGLGPAEEIGSGGSQVVYGVKGTRELSQLLGGPGDELGLCESGHALELAASAFEFDRGDAPKG